MAKNDVTHALKSVAEQVSGRKVKGVLSRGSFPKRTFQVFFEDGGKPEYLVLPKPANRSLPPVAAKQNAVSSTDSRELPDSRRRKTEEN